MSRMSRLVTWLAVFGAFPAVSFAPDPTDCKVRCAKLKEELKARCIRADGTIDLECLAAVEARVAECLKACSAEPPVPEPTCPELCKRKALEEAELCVKNGGNREACYQGLEKRVEECLRLKCNIQPPEPPPSCEDRCAKLKRELKARCIGADGTIDLECLAAVEARVAECLKACSAEPPVPEPTCPELCKRKALEEAELCVKNGGNREECYQGLEKRVEECLRLKCNIQPPEPPKDCEGNCAIQAESLFRKCVASGGGEEECRLQADALLSVCLERCSVGRPCENRCAVAAEIVAQGCALGGLSKEECSRIANLVLERCVAICRPGPTCQERCAEVAASAARECAARGGTKAKCADRAEEVLASCVAKCDGADSEVPPCDAQCERKAEALATECVAQGGDRARCASIRAKFLESCLAEHASNCTEETKAAGTRFRPFIRGDSNRDGRLDVSDPIYMLGWLFHAGTKPGCADAADANDDGKVDIADPIAVLGHLFLGAGPLPEPHGSEGQDGTSDGLVCAE